MAKKPTVYEFIPKLGQLRDDVLFLGRTTDAENAWLPNENTAAARPISSSPGLTSERPESQAERTTVSGASDNRSRS